MHIAIAGNIGSGRFINISIKDITPSIEILTMLDVLIACFFVTAFSIVIPPQIP